MLVAQPAGQRVYVWGGPDTTADLAGANGIGGGGGGGGWVQWPGLQSVSITRARTRTSPHRRRLRPVGERPAAGNGIWYGTTTLGWEVSTVGVSMEFMAMLVGSTMTVEAHRTSLSWWGDEDVPSREPWLIRLGQRLCGFR